MKKRLLSLLLALVMLVGMILATSLTAFAATTKVGRINAVGAGYGYSSTLGAYAPVFSTLEAYDTAGNKINISNFVDASRYAFYTSASFTSANKLTTEPQYGETYYFGIAVDLYVDDVSYDYDHDSIINNSTVSLPGFEVEYDGLMEREMGSYLQIIYKATRVYPVYVGGVGMRSGDYLAVGATKTQTTKPSGGYAYYKNGTLTLNNYSYEGKGYLYNSSKGYYAVIYTKNDLPLILIGNNTLTQTYSNSDMIYVDGANLTVGGDGKLTGTAEGYGLYVDKDITINGGTVEVSTYYTCILSYGEVIINDGDITAESEDRIAIYSEYDLTINGGNVTATGGDKAIGCGSSGTFSVAEGMNIQASTTVDGTLGEYVAANRRSYKKIVITTPVYVGGVGMFDGDYLANGATKTQTTKPSGGYAYYKDGTLTLNNYSYEGKGYLYDSEEGYYATVYANQDLTVELVGTNSLKQTASESNGIYVGVDDSKEKLTIQGDGSLNVTGTFKGIAARGAVTVNGGTIISTATDGGRFYSISICSERESVIINGGNVTVSGDYGLCPLNGYCEIYGGTVTATGIERAIRYYSSYGFTVAEGMNIQASTTADGELGEYVAANHDSYKKIVIKPDAGNVLLGDVNCNGEIEKYDYILVKRAVLGTITLSELQEKCADVNKKDGVEKYDYILVKRHVLKTYTIKN